MDTIVHLLGRATAWAFYPFDLLPGMLGLVAFSAVSGVALLWLFGRLTHQASLERARDRMSSAVYEVRLFADSPKRIVLAQLRLLFWSGYYLVLVTPALLVLSLPLTLCFVHLESRYGFSSLAEQESTLVRVELGEGVAADDVRLIEDEELRTTAPSVYVEPERAKYFRLGEVRRAVVARFVVAGETVTKVLSGDSGAAYVSPARARGLAGILAVGQERPLPTSSAVASISVKHPSRDVRILGIAAPWWVHWLALSTVAALVAKKRLKVVI